MTTPFIQVVTTSKCGHEDCDIDCRLLLTHKAIDLGMVGHPDMTADDFVKLAVRWMVSEMFMNKHFFAREDIYERLLQSMTDLRDSSKRKVDELKSEGISREERMKCRRVIIANKQKIDAIKAQMNAITIDIERAVMKYTRLEKAELAKQRDWKDFVVKHWDPKLFCECEEAHIYNACHFHADDSLKTIVGGFPSIYANMKELMRSNFNQEYRYEGGDMIEPIAQQKSAARGFAHALVKRSKFKYEYLVGPADQVDAKVLHADTIIFIEDLPKVFDGYRQKIKDGMTIIVRENKSKRITFDQLTFVVKFDDSALFKKIVQIYKKAHDLES